jgi:hypothetical protein
VTTQFSKAPALGHWLNYDTGRLSLPIRFEAPVGPAWLSRLLRWKWGDTAVYRYTADAERPLTLVLSDGVAYQPCREFETDMGSVPLPIQSLYPRGLLVKDRWLRSYLLHDWLYMGGGLWVRRPGQTAFRFEPMPKEKADWLLYVAAMIEGAPEKLAKRIHWAVDRFGTGVWSRRNPLRVAWKLGALQSWKAVA